MKLVSISKALLDEYKGDPEMLQKNGINYTLIESNVKYNNPKGL